MGKLGYPVKGSWQERGNLSTLLPNLFLNLRQRIYSFPIIFEFDRNKES